MAIEDFKILERANVVGDIVKYIEKELPIFPSSQEFINILESKRNENQHSLSFCVYMTNSCKSEFYFARENAQHGTSVVDIGVYKGAILVFTIEVKLLPTPIKEATHSRTEHEYVYGKGAGIQRFKDEKHGRDNADNLLYENGLIAFIKENDFEFWMEKVNNWILAANWDKSEMLKKVYFKSAGKLTSTHTRVNNSEVLLHHFWINVA